jgi:hypothetical protein
MLAQTSDASRISSMHLLRSLRRRFRRQDIDLDTEAEATAMASDRLSIRISQAAGSPSSSGGLVTPTPDVLHPHEDERQTEGR